MAHEAVGMIELVDAPAMLVVADSDSAAARARRSAELAGCRVSDVIGLEGAPARLDRQSGRGVVFLEIEADPGEPLDLLLDHLETRAAGRGLASIISAPIEQIDAVIARTASPLIHHLCAAEEWQRVAAIAIASATSRRVLNDIGKEQGLPPLDEISRDVARLAATLATLAEREKRAQRSLPHHPGSGGAPEPMDGPAVRAVIRARRLREQYFGTDLFADPAWDILLDLYAARLEKQKVAVSSLCIAAAVPATTALRWIKTLTDMGLLLRAADPQDGRRVYIELAPDTAAGLEAYLSAANRISPLIL